MVKVGLWESSEPWNGQELINGGADVAAAAAAWFGADADLWFAPEGSNDVILH